MTSVLKPGPSRSSMMATDDSGHSDLVQAVAALKVANSPTRQPDAREEPADAGSGGLDSGYASQSSTPDSLKSTFVDRAVTSGRNLWPQPFRKTRQLRPYNKVIPKLTWDRFIDLREQYAENLNRLTRSLPNCPSALMTLQVLGEDEETAEPWVFVQCDKAVYKKISSFFKQPLIKADFEPPHPDDRSPRLRVLVCPLKPRQLAKDADLSMTDEFVVDDEVIEIFAQKRSDTYALQIMVETPQGMRKATMGGIITLVDKSGEKTLFGMTAGHFLQKSVEQSQDEPSENLEDDFDTEDGFELDFSSVEANTEEEEENTPNAEAEDRRNHSTDLSEWSKLGNVAGASHTPTRNGTNLDWALITFEQSHLSFWNRFNLFGRLHVSLDEPSGQESLVCMMSARGLKFGILSHSWSYMMLPPGNILVRTYLLSFSNSETLQSGDSGAWVVDGVTHAVFGHLVASDVFGRGYVMPICDLFEDIKDRFSAESISIPSMEEIRSTLGGRSAPYHHRQPPYPDAYQSNLFPKDEALVPMPDFPVHEDYNRSPSDIRIYPPANYPPTSYSPQYNPSNYYKPLYPHPSEVRERDRKQYRVPDSGYSSMNTTPNHSPPVSPPQIIDAPKALQGPFRDRSSQTIPVRSDRPTTSWRRPAVEIRADANSDPTGETRAQKFKEAVKKIL